MQLIQGRTAAGNYVPLSVDEDGKLITSGGGGGGGYEEVAMVYVSADTNYSNANPIANFTGLTNENMSYKLEYLLLAETAIIQPAIVLNGNTGAVYNFQRITGTSGSNTTQTAFHTVGAVCMYVNGEANLFNTETANKLARVESSYGISTAAGDQNRYELSGVFTGANTPITSLRVIPHINSSDNLLIKKGSYVRLLAVKKPA